RLVVADVVDLALAAALDGGDRGRRDVLHVRERPVAAAVADERELALADHLELIAAGREAGARAVEAAVAEDHPAGAGYEHLEAPDRGMGLAQAARRVGVERVGLGLHRA